MPLVEKYARYLDPIIWTEYLRKVNEDAMAIPRDASRYAFSIFTVNKDERKLLGPSECNQLNGAYFSVYKPETTPLKERVKGYFCEQLSLDCKINPEEAATFTLFEAKRLSLLLFGKVQDNIHLSDMYIGDAEDNILGVSGYLCIQNLGEVGNRHAVDLISEGCEDVFISKEKCKAVAEVYEEHAKKNLLLIRVLELVAVVVGFIVVGITTFHYGRHMSKKDDNNNKPPPPPPPLPPLPPIVPEERDDVTSTSDLEPVYVYNDTLVRRLALVGASILGTIMAFGLCRGSCSAGVLIDSGSSRLMDDYTNDQF